METPLTQNMRPDGARLSLKEYEAAGGYQGLRKALRMTPQEVQEAVRESNLRGRGLSHGSEMELCSDGRRCTASEVSHRERR
jgi:NADH:ubiquinone oxidoreductase subunit F (NADH-binding)